MQSIPNTMNSLVIDMKLDFSSYSAVGRRKNNEDSVFAGYGDHAFLAMVCDGVGGSHGGELASACAVETISSALLSKSLDIDELEDAVIEANTAICALGKKQDGPKTTLALLWLEENKAIAANMGDSRIYQFRNGEIIYQSRDHSVPQLAVMAGEIKSDQIRSHKEKNVITRCLGSDGPVKLDRKRLDVLPGDRFLICSDGFWEPVLEEDMLAAVSHSNTAEAWLSEMKKVALTKESDNHTAVAIVVP